MHHPTVVTRIPPSRVHRDRVHLRATNCSAPLCEKQLGDPRPALPRSVEVVVVFVFFGHARIRRSSQDSPKKISLFLSLPLALALPPHTHTTTWLYPLLCQSLCFGRKLIWSEIHERLRFKF